MEIKSPISNKANCVLEKEISTDFIVGNYRKIFHLDFQKYFSGINKLSLYRCLDTGYRFYIPAIEGDSNFYERLQEFPWYYMDWKWEHEQAYRLLKQGDLVLEVGFGKGGFLRRLKKAGIRAQGIELNQKSVDYAKTQGLSVSLSSLAEYAEKYPRTFDAVCSFQVLEHVAEAGKMVADMAALLKPGGTLIISVPNNCSFIKDDKYGILNMPPHHLGLWDEKSLAKLPEVFTDIKLDRFCFEPLQPYHYRYYYQVKAGYKIEGLLGFFGKLMNKAVSICLIPLFAIFAKRIKGHTIFAVYKKISP